MHSLKSLIFAAPLVLATAASAQPARYTDAQFIAATRCEALMSSAALGRQDTHGLEARLKAEGVVRSGDVIDRAEEAREDALRAVSHAGPYGRAALVAERDGPCRSLEAAGVMSAAAASAGSTRTN